MILALALLPAISAGGSIARADDVAAASAINIPAAPGFDGLTTNQAIERLSNYGNIYKAAIGRINQDEAAGAIGSSQAAQLRATVAARIQLLNANYFAWRDAYDKSVSPGSGGSGGSNGTGNGSSGSGAVGGGGSGSGSGSGNRVTTGVPSGGKTGSPGSGRKKKRADRRGGPRGGDQHSPNTQQGTPGPPRSGGTPSGAGSPRSNATLRAAANTPNAKDAGGDSKHRSSGGEGAGAGDGAGSPLVDDLRRRATVSRAVDAVPIGLRLLLLALLFTIASLSAISLRERRRARNVERVAQLDYLTGLSNREGFDRMLGLEWRRASRYDRPLGLVFVDLDHFKLYNDTYGHLAGDRLLREVAAAIGETARGSDFTARLGGDEFVVLCPEATEEGLESLTERLKEEVSSIEVTLSIGWALQRPDDLGQEDLLSRADAAMYRAKDRRRRPVSVGNPMLGSLRRSTQS